jgi:hypothetical protein
MVAHGDDAFSHAGQAFIKEPIINITHLGGGTFAPGPPTLRSGRLGVPTCQADRPSRPAKPTGQAGLRVQ